MASITVPHADEVVTHSEVAVRGRELARHYGQGDTTVHALRGVDLDVTPERLTAEIGDFLDECWKPRRRSGASRGRRVA